MVGFRAALARRSAAGAIVAALFLCLPSAGVFADDKVGSVAYLEGELSVVRDGEEVTGISTGSALQNFDLVRTSADGLAELDINAPQLPRITVKIGNSLWKPPPSRDGSRRPSGSSAARSP